eukprot:363862-Chlamydomonas_euryale.AAC.17
MRWQTRWLDARRCARGRGGCTSRPAKVLYLFHEERSTPVTATMSCACPLQVHCCGRGAGRGAHLQAHEHEGQDLEHQPLQGQRPRGRPRKCACVAAHRLALGGVGAVVAQGSEVGWRKKQGGGGGVEAEQA